MIFALVIKESLDSYRILHMNLILNIVENFKYHTKKKLDKDSVIREARKILGLSDEATPDAHANFVKPDALDFKDSACTNNRSKANLCKSIAT